jgi:hypothetical protein
VGIVFVLLLAATVWMIWPPAGERRQPRGLTPLLRQVRLGLVVTSPSPRGPLIVLGPSRRGVAGASDRPHLLAPSAPLLVCLPNVSAHFCVHAILRAAPPRR